MHFSKIFSASVLVTSALANPKAVAQADVTDLDAPLLSDRSAAACATCVSQCVFWLGLCTAVCGPWSEIFTGPLPCTECLVVAGASQQCFQCVEKCEGGAKKKRDALASSGPSTRVSLAKRDPKYLMFSSCAGQEFKDNACTGLVEPDLGENGNPGICTMQGYAKTGESGNGVNCPSGQECDTSVGPSSNCAPVATA